LGRGLDALIPRGSSGVQEIELDRIDPNPRQPRQHFAEEALEELAASIREHGILQPVIVARAGSRYTLIAGERRWRAARLAQLPAVPALVKEASAASSVELALVENVQRADLSPLEEAGAYRALIDEHGLTQEQVALRVARSRVAVANRLRLLALPPKAKSLLSEGVLTEGHARALLGLSDHALLDALAEEVVQRQLSVRDTEELVRRAETERGAETPSGARSSRRQPPTSLEEDLQRALGTRVQLVQSRRGGKVVIHYYDDDQLDGLLELLLGRDPA
jgi:ParB family chromosome partitioning protein